MVRLDQQASKDLFRQDLNSHTPTTAGMSPTVQLTGGCHFDDEEEEDGKNQAVQSDSVPSTVW